MPHEVMRCEVTPKPLDAYAVHFLVLRWGVSLSLSLSLPLPLPEVHGSGAGDH